jgi:hypothetical protein
MQCVLYKIYFWKVFHMYYKLICILYALLCGQNFILVKSGCYTQLSCYALDNVDTNEKKQDWFLNGLNDGLAYALEARDFTNFLDMVDKALVLKN